MRYNQADIAPIFSRGHGHTGHLALLDGVG